jgi:hypothetical protein
LLDPSLELCTVDPTQLLFSVNCLFFKDDSAQVFTVKVPESDNISILKKLVKEENAHDLAHLDAKDLIDLILYKVSLSTAEVDSRRKEANIDFKANSAVTRIILRPLEELRDVFPGPLQKVMFIFSLNMLRLVLLSLVDFLF